MIVDILTPFVAIAVAELGDKSQLFILLLASKTRKRLQLLFGAILAFLIVDGVAILAGSWITNIVPVSTLKIVSGIIFIVLGALLLREKEVESKMKLYSKNIFLSGFILIFIAEWGDKTQIASALFATKYNALMVLIGVILSLTILSIMAVYFGKFISGKVDRRVMTKIAGTIFVLVGILSVLL